MFGNFEKILKHPKVQDLLIRTAEKGINKSADWVKEKFAALDKPVAKEITAPEKSSGLLKRYDAKLDSPIANEIKTFSPEINKYISSPEEARIYLNAGLKEGVVNGRPALLKSDINFNQKDEFGLSNAERMKNGNPPLAPNGEIIELHHIGQKPYSPFAELTRTEHRGKGNDIILHDKNKMSEIDRNAFQRERTAHWQNRIGVEA